MSSWGIHMNSSTDKDFRSFAERFVRCYWEEVSRGSPEFANHSDPCEQSPEELLAEIDWETPRQSDNAVSTDGQWSLQMANTSGDAWRFTFRLDGSEWVLVTATSGSRRKPARVDLLDETYARDFRPFLNRIIRKARNGP